MTDWTFPVEVPSTEDVYEAYKKWNDPAYGNPEAQAAWEKANREEFDQWLRNVTLGEPPQYEWGNRYKKIPDMYHGGLSEKEARAYAERFPEYRELVRRVRGPWEDVQ